MLNKHLSANELHNEVTYHFSLVSHSENLEDVI